MRSRSLRVAVALVFLVPFLAIPFTVDAQTVAGTLQGTVTDTSGAPLPNAMRTNAEPSRCPAGTNVTSTPDVTGIVRS